MRMTWIEVYILKTEGALLRKFGGAPPDYVFMILYFYFSKFRTF